MCFIVKPPFFFFFFHREIFFQCLGVTPWLDARRETMSEPGAGMWLTPIEYYVSRNEADVRVRLTHFPETLLERLGMLDRIHR